MAINSSGHRSPDDGSGHCSKSLKRKRLCTTMGSRVC